MYAKRLCTMQSLPSIHNPSRGEGVGVRDREFVLLQIDFFDKPKALAMRALISYYVLAGGVVAAAVVVEVSSGISCFSKSVYPSIAYLSGYAPSIYPSTL